MLEGLFLQGCLKAIIQIYQPVVMYKKHLSQQCQKKTQFKADNIRTYGFAYVFYPIVCEHIYIPRTLTNIPCKNDHVKRKISFQPLFYEDIFCFQGSTMNIN